MEVRGYQILGHPIQDIVYSPQIAGMYQEAGYAIEKTTVEIQGNES